MFFRFLYQLLSQISWHIIQWGAPFNPTLRALYQNRKMQWPLFQRSSESKEKLLWMHCASLGEYEQGKSFLKAWREEHPTDKILVSFFSNSGYEKVHPGDLIDYTVYLPWDTKRKVSRFLDHFHPDRVVFVKYEFWYNYLKELNQRDIPTIFISLILEKDHFLFKKYGAFLLNELRQVKQLFVQDRETMQHLQERGFENISLTGDTRVDTVAELPQIPYEDAIVHQFVSRQRPVVIVGSAWEADIHLLSTLSPESLRLFHWILVPHQIEDRFIRQILETFKYLGW
jgi:3-deoxy-D-manno-octulosonic-acid transferase